MSRRGDANGPTLTLRTALLDTRVRATTGGFSGREGVIVGNPGTWRPTVRWDNGDQSAVEAERLQLVLRSNPQEELVTCPHCLARRGARNACLICRGVGQVVKGSVPDPLRRTNATWNF